MIRERRGSCSLLQRALGIGYGRAARLIDFMAEDGIVGQYNGSQARDVLISLEDWEARKSGECAAGKDRRCHSQWPEPSKVGRCRSDGEAAGSFDDFGASHVRYDRAQTSQQDRAAAGRAE